MASTPTPDKGYALQVTGQQNGIWGSVLNSNFSIIDNNFGGLLNKSVAGNSNITVSSDEAQNVSHNLTGALTGNIKYILPNKGSFYIVNNATSGAFTLTVVSNVSGTGITIPQGTKAFVFVDSGNTDVSSNLSYLPALTVDALTISTPIGPASGGSPLFAGGTTTGTENAQILASTVPNSFVLTTKYVVTFTSGFSNTSSTTLNVNSTGNIAVKINSNAGLSDTYPGAIQSGCAYIALYDGTQYILMNPTPVPSTSGQLPVGSLYMNGSTPTDPATLLGYGTWASLGAGRVLIGAGTGTDSNGVSRTFSNGDTGGEYVHTLTIPEIPSHTHTIFSQLRGPSGGTGRQQLPTTSTGDLDTQSTGGGGTHNNIQPYLAAYFWMRTA